MRHTSANLPIDTVALARCLGLAGNDEPFERFVAETEKPLKRLRILAPSSTGLKPGVNESRMTNERAEQMLFSNSTLCILCFPLPTLH